MFHVDTTNQIVKFVVILHLIKGRKFYYRAVYDKHNSINVAYITPVSPIAGDITTAIFNPDINFELILDLIAKGEFDYVTFNKMCSVEKSQLVLNCRNLYNPVPKSKVKLIYSRV